MLLCRVSESYTTVTSWSPLLRTLTKNFKSYFRPFKVYSYQSLKHSVSRLTKRKGFVQLCEEWRNRSASDDIIGDIYNGQVWREFSTFLSHENSWCLALNVDWFQPFSHVTDSMSRNEWTRSSIPVNFP